jgi:hypothetical protein
MVNKKFKRGDLLIRTAEGFSKGMVLKFKRYADSNRTEIEGTVTLSVNDTFPVGHNTGYWYAEFFEKLEEQSKDIEIC